MRRGAILVGVVIGGSPLIAACSGGTASSEAAPVALAAAAPQAPPPVTQMAAMSVAAAATAPAAARGLVSTPAPDPAAEAQAAPPRPAGSPESLLRTEVQKWKNVPYRDNGTTRTGIGNAGFVRAVFQSAFGTTIPASYDEQYRTGKLVARDALVAGDLVFFEGSGFGPFRSRTVGIYLGKNQVALARREDGVVITSLAEPPWDRSYKTARRMPSGEVAAPMFDVAKYGSNREALLRDIAKAWSGTLYRAGGKTFDGIGNDEFVREVYGAIYETDLEGDPGTWTKMGQTVARDKLEAGDIILYDAGGVGSILSQRHAGLYIGDGEFVSAVRGSAVTINKLSDPRWKAAYRDARRIDPDVLARAEEARTAGRTTPRGAPAARTSTRTAAAAPLTSGAALHVVTDPERKLRAVTESWRGTPYKLGGSSRSGIDCSAFSRVLYDDVYKVDLPRTAEEQERLGKPVDRRQLQAGDLIFFRTQGMGPLFRSRHVGVYLGGGEFAQASGRRGVTISSLDNRYWSGKYHSARRPQKTS